MLLHSVAAAGGGAVLDRWRQLPVDNDVIAGDDGGYTGGLAFNWGYTGFPEFDAETLPAWIHSLTRDLYIATAPDRQRAVAYTLDAKAFTPNDIDSRRLVEDDRPYAGLLLWSADLYAFNRRVAESPDPSMTAHALPGGRRISWQVFLTAYGRYVANDITIDGNTFTDSHSVSLELGQAIGGLGFAFAQDNWGMLLAYRVGTDQFAGQDYDTAYGTVSAAYRF